MTTPYSPPLDLVTTAVLELLRGTGRTVYDGAYAGDPLRPTYPYAVLYRIAGGSADPFPDLDANLREVTAAYQVTTVSNVRNQAEATGRLMRDRVLARAADGYLHPLAMPPGWACIGRRPDSAAPGIDRTGDHPNAIFSQPARFYLTITPA